jgi:hypothetical protein
VAGSCEHGNKSLGPVKDWGFIDQLNDYQVLNKNHPPCTLLSMER